MKELVYHRLLLPAAERWADKVAIHDGEYHGTLGEHTDRVLRLAHAMSTELGLERGDRFAVMSCNSHEYLELYHAGMLGGTVINPLNLRLAGTELQYILADSGTVVAFVDAVFAEHFIRNIEPVRADLALRHVVLIGDADIPHDIAYDGLLAAGQPLAPDEPEETDPCVLMYTGGTTGMSKGVVLENRAEILNSYHVGVAVGLGEERVYLHQTPMFHAASTAAIIGVPAAGSTSVFIPLFEPVQVMDAVERYECNWTVMVPTMIAMTLNHPAFRRERLLSLQDLFYGASPMPAALLDRLFELLPDMNLWQGYGMTEASSVLTLLTPEDHRRGGQILRSAGRPVIGVTLSIRREDGSVADVGETGEVCARGGNFMREYWNRPEQTEESFRDGWYHSGDAGYRDEEGYLYLVDRVKDMIVSGGENVYSIEVENAISTHPAVAQVAVIGIPHDVLGEQVHAIVVPHAGAGVTEDEIKAHARQTIAGYKVPKTVELRTEPLPLSGALKPLKRELRKPYWEHHETFVH